MTSTTRIDTHDTEPTLWKALSRAFPVLEYSETRWVEISVDAVELRFFAPRSLVPAQPEPAGLGSSLDDSV